MKGGLEQIANKALEDDYPVTGQDVFRNLFMACCNEITRQCELYAAVVNR